MNNTYIAMCREAAEIQKAWKTARMGDLFWVQLHSNTTVEGVVTDFTYIEGGIQVFDVYGTQLTLDHLTWLPRIEDLIEIYLTDSCGNQYSALRELAQYAKNKVTGANETTAQEWTIMLVMHERYSKDWNGKTWRTTK